MKYEYEPGKKYTADELEDIMRASWKSDEEYFAMCEFVSYAPMTPEEQAKLRESGLIDAFLHA